MEIKESWAIEVEHLSFQHSGQSRMCLDHVNLKVLPGERFGLFGPNGAGKTTFMNLMTGVLSFDKGSIKLLGRDIRQKGKAKNSLFGFVPQDLSFYHELTPVENLEFFGAWAGMQKKEIQQRTVELLDVLGLGDVQNKQVGLFSGGMKRRVNLAIGVIHNPPILFLDEPTVGVDVQSRHAIIGYLKELNRNGTTLFYTSHQLGEAEQLCERIALIDKGSIILTDQLDNLLSQHKGGLEDIFLDLTGKAYRDW